jgi:hypothetical protein
MYCVEIQLTPISSKKMQEKINQFTSEYEKNHLAKTFILCSNNDYKGIKFPNDFKLIKQLIPSEIIV